MFPGLPWSSLDPMVLNRITSINSNWNCSQFINLRVYMLGLPFILLMAHTGFFIDCVLLNHLLHNSQHVHEFMHLTIVQKGLF